ncbi:MAG TPA: hypothetical protein VEJ67_01280 [Candidatus Cybelea sp.]|nr:hypothetical protein [Candidatus Cybelea sp.]
MWTYLLGPILSLLPTRWREEHLWPLRINWPRAALFSGLAELVIFAPWAWTSPSLVNTSLSAYFAAEGIVRFYAAISSGEALGSFPLVAASDIWRQLRRWRRPELPRVDDEVSPGGTICDLKIASCRERREWTYPFTIRYAGSYFQVIGHVDVRSGPRPYVYSLRRLCPGEIAGGLQDYDPQDITRAPEPLKPLEE